MLVPYNCCTKKFEDHYQTGSGLAYYQGLSRQRGYGLGGFFRRLFRSAMPFLIKGAKTVGKEALRTGALIASDVAAGENFKEAAKQRGREVGKVLTQKAVKKVQSMVGNGKYKKARKRPHPFISSKATKVRRRVKRLDYLDH